MRALQAVAATVEQASRDEWFAAPPAGTGGSRAAEARNVDSPTDCGAAEATDVDSPMGCVWTGYRSNGSSCPSRIPLSVVAEAWRRELEQAGVPKDRFFRVTWQDGVWLGYGLSDGRIRGVYCPSHSAEREERSFVADSRGSQGTSDLLYA